MVESAKLMGADEETAKQEMKKALQFEIKLANATTAREFRRDPNNLYNPTTLDQFENLILKLQSTPIKDSNYA